jgi:hypothetical protein
MRTQSATARLKLRSTSALAAGSGHIASAAAWLPVKKAMSHLVAVLRTGEGDEAEPTAAARLAVHHLGASTSQAGDTCGGAEAGRVISEKMLFLIRRTEGRRSPKAAQARSGLRAKCAARWERGATEAGERRAAIQIGSDLDVQRLSLPTTAREQPRAAVAHRKRLNATVRETAAAVDRERATRASTTEPNEEKASPSRRSSVFHDSEPTKSLASSDLEGRARQPAL